MAKVGVRIEGTETLSPASASAAKSLRQLKEETENLKKSAQNILAPLINLRSTIMAVGGAAGLIQGFRAMSREIGEALDAFAKSDDVFRATVDGMKASVTAFKAGIGGMVAEIAGPFMRTMTRLYQAMADNMATARDLRQAINDVGKGEMVSDAQKIEDQLHAVLTEMVKIIDLQDKKVIRPNMIEYYDAELDRLGQVMRALIAQKRLLEEMASITTMMAAIKATTSEAEGIAAAQEAAIEAARELIRRESPLGRIMELEQKIATLKAFSFKNEEVYEQNRIEALRRLVDQLNELKGIFAESLGATIEAYHWELPRVSASEYQRPVTTGWQAEYDATSATALGEASGGTSIRDATRGSGGLEQVAGIAAQQQAVAGFGQALLDTTVQMGGFAGTVVQSVISMGWLGALFELIKPVLSGIMDVLAPALNGVLVPLVGALAIVGRALGGMLAPIIEALAPVFELVGRIVVALIPVFDALSRPVQLVAGLLGYLGDWIGYLGDQIYVFIYNLLHPLNQIGGSVVRPQDIATFWAALWAQVTRPLATGEWNVGEVTAAGTDYINANGGFGGGGSGGTGYGGGGGYSGRNTTVQQVPDIYVYITIEGNVIGAGGIREVGEYVARAAEAYAGIGGRIHIQEAIT